MSTVSAILRNAVERLGAAGVDTPQLDAELLLAAVLGKERRWVWTYPDTEVSDETQAVFESLLARRERREPLAYLLGEWEFYGRAFVVSPAVLIPRPETELLVEAVIEWARDNQAGELVDVGTGSGAIAVTLALELPTAHVTAIDVEASALQVAQRNAQRYQIDQRLHWLHGDLLQPLLPAAHPVDAIVANLPYIAEEAMPHLMPEVRDYEPQRALQAAHGGFDLLHRLIAQSPALLRPGGLLALEVGMGQAEPLVQELTPHQWHQVRIVYDYAGIARHVLAVRV